MCWIIWLHDLADTGIQFVLWLLLSFIGAVIYLFVKTKKKKKSETRWFICKYFSTYNFQIYTNSNMKFFTHAMSFSLVKYCENPS
jgi:hypothetical protein